MGDGQGGAGRQRWGLAILVVLLLAGAGAHVRLWNVPTEGQDIYYAWVEGGRIAAGENPYARVLSGDMLLNDKYATYFALFYELSAVTRLAGLDDYATWIAFWRVVFLGFTLAIGVLLFVVAYQQGRIALAFFGLGFWLFNRWTLHLTQIAHLDPVPILFMLASLALFDRHRVASLLLFGASLALKQIGVFLAPLYLIWVWRAAGTDAAGRRDVLLAMLLIATVPLLTALPFLVWNARGFVSSILFSVTRLPSDHLGVPSFDTRMGWIGLPGKVPMLVLMALVYWMAARGNIGRYTAGLLIFATFVDFNAVLFRQYVAWALPFIPLAVLETTAGRGGAVAQRQSPA